MEYFAGLDISMKETHICVVDRDGKVVYEAKAATSPAAIAAELAKAPAAQRIVFETGRMATTLYHGLQALGLAVVCIESRHACQSLKSLATHKTDRNSEVAAGACGSRAHYCPQEAGRSARHAREPDSRLGARLWGPAATWSQSCIRGAGQQRQW
jgi:transposase